MQPRNPPPNLKTILALANTGWTTGNVENVLQKLQKIGIRDVSGLASSLRNEAGRGLNAELRNAGEKGFGRSTLQALQEQLVEFFPQILGNSSSPPASAAPAKGPDARGGRAAAATLAKDEQANVDLQDWIVVHERVVKRAEPSLEAQPRGILRKGRTVRGFPAEFSGMQWLQVPDKERDGTEITVYMLISGESLGLGALLEPRPAADGEAAPEPLAPETQSLGLAAGVAREDCPWLLGIRAGNTVFLTAHTGLRLDVEGEAEGKPNLGATWNSQMMDLPLLVCEQEVLRLLTQAPEGERDHLRARFSDSGTWQKLVVERKDNSGPICSGDQVFLRAHTGRLLTPAGEKVRAESAGAGDFPGWTIERADGKDGELWHGTSIRLLAPVGDLLCVEGNRVFLRPEGEGGQDEGSSLLIEKDIRKSDVPEWEAPAPAGWWRVTHRPSIYVHVGPSQFNMMPAAYSTDTVLAMDMHWLSDKGELWLRLRDERRDGQEQWARTSAPDMGFDKELMELLPTQCGPPSDDVRTRHYTTVEAMHRARDQGRRAVERGDRPASLTYAWVTEEMLADVYAAEHASTVERSLGHPTAPYSSPAAMALVGDADAASSFARRLLRDGFAICDTALTRREASELAAEADRLDQAGILHEPDQPTPGQRGDRIAWLSETTTKFAGSPSYSPALGSAIDLLKGVADALNPALSRHHAERRAAGDPAHLAPIAHPATEDAVLTVAPRAMLSTYPGGGARYIAHQDNMYRRAVGRRGNPRELTAIIYLQPKDWDAKQDGGELKIYQRTEQFVESPEDKGLREVAYVAPAGGRLVVFFSALWHEVLPAYRMRRALTLWIYRPSVE